MRTHSRRIWPLFAIVAVVALVGLFVLHGIASGVVLFVAVLGLLGTCIYALAGEKVQDGAGGIAGGTNF
jgi:cytochrome c-type biogenesis protein CcmE